MFIETIVPATADVLLSRDFCYCASLLASNALAYALDLHRIRKLHRLFWLASVMAFYGFILRSSM